ncbi:MAG: hypothetical protein KF886_14025 [Candidatus Hydrogenedentes bacterium]|nr:hypothetical protein [Candidatus Hydrogenedentota bacterium]
MTAKTWNSGFADAHDSYNSMGAASDGNVYYALSSTRHDVGAQLYRFEPGSGVITHLGDLTEACGEKDTKTLVQGKSHNVFVEANGKLYFATHAGYYSIIDGKEQMGIPPEGWKPYPGGHVLSYDLATGAFEDLGIPLANEGILTMAMDTARGRIFGITWPAGHFVRYDLAQGAWKDFGPISAKGESGQGAEYRTLCRSIAVDPRDGSAYYTVSEGDIFRYDHAKDAIEPVTGENLRKDYFGLYDPTSPGHMAYNWRQTIWNPVDSQFYGVHGNSGYLFRYDPTANRVVVLDRITSEVSKRSGMFDQFSYGYLGFELAPDGRTLVYLTGGPIYQDGRRVAGKESTAMGEAKGLENLHLITWDIPTGQYLDHGAIFYENGDRPLYVNSLAIAKDGAICFLARITENGHLRSDLVTVRIP